jgi:hypothetical protein
MNGGRREGGLKGKPTENSFEKDLVPLWGNAFGFRENKGFVPVCTSLECATICSL